MELYGRCDCCASQMYTCVTLAVIFLTCLLFLLYANFSHVPSPFLFLYFQIFFSLASGGIQTTSRVIQSTVITFKAMSIMLLFQQAFFTTLCISSMSHVHMTQQTLHNTASYGLTTWRASTLPRIILSLRLLAFLRNFIPL